MTDSLDDIDIPPASKRIARATLRQLYEVINTKQTISYFEEEGQDLERVLDIFIRMNSGGTPLSYSDLLLSIAVAQWTNKDARHEIHHLVDKMNNVGDMFNFSKDIVLKAGLMLSDIGNVGFKVENFNKSNMTLLEQNWERISNALMLATELLANFGLCGQNLPAASPLLPVAYYIYVRELDESYLTSRGSEADREAIRIWVVRSLLKVSGIWGSGLDTLLTILREIIKQDNAHGFPVDKLEKAMAARGKSLLFTTEEIEDFVEFEYGNKRIFLLFSLLFPEYDFSQHLHVDHIYPQSLFSNTKLKRHKPVLFTLAENL